MIVPRFSRTSAEPSPLVAFADSRCPIISRCIRNCRPVKMSCSSASSAGRAAFAADLPPVRLQLLHQRVEFLDDDERARAEVGGHVPPDVRRRERDLFAAGELGPAQQVPVASLSS